MTGFVRINGCEALRANKVRKGPTHIVGEANSREMLSIVFGVSPRLSESLARSEERLADMRCSKGREKLLENRAEPVISFVSACPELREWMMINQLRNSW